MDSIFLILMYQASSMLVYFCIQAKMSCSWVKLINTFHEAR